ncbi:MAG: deoxyribodipyrimidine photolyase [Planctomycetota bacterium]
MTVAYILVSTPFVSLHASFMQSDVPESRVWLFGDRPINGDGQFVLYWMVANRRPAWNYSLDRAIDWAVELGKPLVVLEALRSDYRWASDRLHRFVLQGMADNAAAFAPQKVLHYAYVEAQENAGKGLVRALARRAAVVVSDDYPCFFLPAAHRAARPLVPVRFELIDSNGLYPIRSTDRVFSRAVDFRRHLQKTITPHLVEMPRSEPFAGRNLPPAPELDQAITSRWPIADLSQGEFDLSGLPIDHSVKPSQIHGGAVAGQQQLERFLDDRLPIYDEDRNQPDEEAASGLSPYLHFGHVSAHQVFAAAAERDGWNPGKVAPKATAKSSGWWGGGVNFEAFLDELITWREIGFNRCALTRDFDRYESLPGWAQQTLAEHAGDERDYVYDPAQFESAATHDEIWNAAQTELVREGRMHNYLRMLWGKKTLHWSATPRDALAVMIELNNKYALDGRDPNSYSGIFWVLGRYDRAWGPERPIFGKIRYMTSDSTRRKLRLTNYLSRYAPQVGRETGRLFD